MIFGQTPTNITQEPKVSLQEQMSQSVKQRFLSKPSWEGQHGPQKVPEPLEAMDFISFQEHEEKKNQVKKESKEMMKASMRTVFNILGVVHALPRQWWRTKAWIPWMISQCYRLA